LPTCLKCGNEVSAEAKFCSNCAAPIVPAPQVPQPETTSATRKSHVGSVIAVVLVLVLVVGAFYGISYQSARGLTIGNVTGRMSYRTGLLGYAEFDVTVSVSSTGVLDITISQVNFGLTIDSLIPFPTIPAMGTTFSRGQTLQYTLRFTSSNPSDLQYISQGGTHQVTVSITAWSSSGIYSGWVTSSTASTWNWASAS
jgi:hypothetical protein